MLFSVSPIVSLYVISFFLSFFLSFLFLPPFFICSCLAFLLYFLETCQRCFLNIALCQRFPVLILLPIFFLLSLFSYLKLCSLMPHRSFVFKRDNLRHIFGEFGGCNINIFLLITCFLNVKSVVFWPIFGQNYVDVRKTL